MFLIPLTRLLTFNIVQRLSVYGIVTVMLVLAQALTPCSLLAQAGSAPTFRTIDTLGLAQAKVFAQTITAEELREYAYTLASDSLQGRETGTEGQRKAARFLSGEMEKFGLPRVGSDYSYEQRIGFESASWDRVRLSIGDKELRHLRDFYAYPAQSFPLKTTFDEVVVLGYGIDSPNYSDFREAGDLEGKAIVVITGEPFGKTGTSLVTGTADTSEWSRNIELKRAAAERYGATVLLVVEPDLQAQIAKNRSRIVGDGLQLADPTRFGNSAAQLNVLYISPGVYSDLVDNNRKRVIRARKKAKRRGKPVAVSAKTSLTLDMEPRKFVLPGENVLGYVRGSDPKLADELVVISAHYDHLGMRGNDIFYGADDNASGTSTVLEIAEAFVTAAKAGAGPKRSVLMLLVSGEEKGLLGSQYYASNPVFPLESTVADINIDMIGRYDEAHSDSTAYIYVIGAGRISPDLDAATQALNQHYIQLHLDYTFDAETDPNRFYFRSDHYNFAKMGIPSVFFFSGVHEDYHRPSDTPDKLDYEKMEKVARTAFVLAWNIANRPGQLNRK